MIELYLLRHADAGDPMAWTGDDADRPLSDKGRRQARRLGAMLDALRWRPDVIVASPKVRAAETARIVGRAVGVKATTDERLAQMLDVGELDALFASHDGARRVVLVGHDPAFSAIASALTGAAIEMKKGAIARIDLPTGKAAAGDGVLRWLIPPGAVPG